MTTPAPPPSPAPPARRARPLAHLVLALALAAQAWQVARLFPSLGSIVDPSTPVVMVDHAIHEYHGALGAGFFRDRGTTWGYDPSFMAGYPETPIWDSSSNLAIAANLLAGGAGGYRPYKLAVAAVAVLGFAALLAGGRAAGLGVGEVAVAGVLAWAYFWVEQPVMFLRTGIFAFVGAGLGSALLLGLCARVDRGPDRWWAWVALAGTGSALLFAHVTAPILVGPGALAFYLAVARRHGRAWHLKVWGAVAWTVAANLVWLVPMWRFRGLRVGSALFLVSESPRFLWDYYTAASLDARVGLVLLLLGGLGLVGWWRGGRRAAAAAFGGSIAGLVLLTGFGSLWEPTRTLEPLRFRLVFCLLLCPPAASTAVLGPGWLARRLGGGRGARAAVAAALVAGGLAWAWLDPMFFRAAAGWLAHRRPLVVGVPAEARPLVDWIRAETDPSARILFEDQLRLLEPTDAESTHWTPLLPALLAPDERQFIGGLYQTAFIRHHRMAAFGDFTLGDRPIDEWTPAQIAAYAERYNVGWVACWSPLSRFTFDRLPGATPVGRVPRPATPGKPPANNEHERVAIARRGGAEAARRYILEGESAYALYRLDRPRSYFLRGKGRLVAAGPDRVELADIEPDDQGVAVLSLHWMDAWRAEPAARIGPEPAAGDPVPFVRIEADRPIPRLVLRNGG